MLLLLIYIAICYLFYIIKSYLATKYFCVRTQDGWVAPLEMTFRTILLYHISLFNTDVDDLIAEYQCRRLSLVCFVFAAVRLAVSG